MCRADFVNARAVALNALRVWRSSRRFADEIFDELISSTELRANDRAFALELFYGVLRNLTLLDFWIGELRSGKVDVDLRDLLRLGLYQLFVAGISEHAAVNETVSLAPKHTRAVVNAVLRNATRQRADLLGNSARQPLALRTSHPEFLVARWRSYFGDAKTEELCHWNNEPPPIYARVNQFKIDIDAFGRNYSDAAKTTVPNFFADVPRAALDAGGCYIQDPSTRLACELLDSWPNERVLDACAAPGGKTGYIAELMQNTGTIVAVDRQSNRLKILRENLERLGVEIARTLQHDWRNGTLSEKEFDRILVDAPCSNTGVLRRRVDARWRLQPNEFAHMQEEQLLILRAVAPLLRKGGALVYSTCSLEPEENEQVVQTFTREMSIFQLQAEQRSLPFRDGFDGAYVAKLIKTA